MKHFGERNYEIRSIIVLCANDRSSSHLKWIQDTNIFALKNGARCDKNRRYI